MKRRKIHQLDPAGGTPGQVPTINPAGTKLEYATPSGGGGGGGGSLPWFVVTDPAYGAIGDNTADDTAAINAAIADLNAAGRGVLYLPAGTYKVTGVLTTITAHATILGDGGGDLAGKNAATSIVFNSTTGYLMTLAHDGMVLESFGLENPTTTTQTSGAGIRVTQGDLNRYRNVTIRGFYDNMTIEDGSLPNMRDVYLVGPVRYGLYLRHIDLVDGGDQLLDGCHFYADARTPTSAIRWESGGGLKMVGCKVNTLDISHVFTYGLDALIGGNTGILNIVGCSFENTSGPSIKGRCLPFGTFQGVTVAGCEFGYYGGAGSMSAIDIAGWDDITVGVNTYIHTGGSSGAAVKLDTCNRVTVAFNTNHGFASEYSLPACTSIKTALDSSRHVDSGTGLTGGGDLSADRTIAIDMTAEAERIRDVIGAAIVQGAGITVTVDDAGDTITIAATATAGLRPLTTESGGIPDLVWDDNNDLVMTEAT